MTEELKTCDFYNEKICTLFSKYFGFNVECENVFLSTIDCDIERECPIKRLEQENKELKDKITALEDKLQLRMASDKESDEFWDEIFSAENYPFNKENAYKELKDYYFVLEQIPKIYLEITGGTLSKTTYFASSVIQAYNDALERYYDKIDDLEYNNNAYRSALEEIKNVLKEICKEECDYTKPKFCGDCDCRYGQILNKINEVLQ